MVGICGWTSNQSSGGNEATTLERMASLLSVNNNPEILRDYQAFYALAASGPPNSIGLISRENVLIAVQGSIRWLDADLANTARQHGAATALADAYRHDGIGFFSRLSGPFALAIVDQANHKSLIAIDRLGISSMFYTVRESQLIFSSNARSIRSHPEVDPEIDPQALFDYLYFHMIPSPRCIYRGVEKLLPGQYLLFEDNKVHKRFYWQPTYSENTETNTALLETEFLDTLRSSISRASESNKTGAFLSGGTDSSTVAGMLREVSGSGIDTYSIGFNAEGYDEMEYARIATKHFGTRPHEYYLTPQDVVDAIPLIAKAYDEPFGNASAVPAYYCAKLAKADNVEVLLAGDGGDELFAGNERYAKQKIFELYFRIPESLRHSLIEPTLLNSPLLGSFKPFAKARSYIQQANVPLPDRLETYNFVNRFPLGDIFVQDFLGRVNTDEPIEYLRETYARANTSSTLDRMLFSDWKFTLADNDLRKVNRMTELAGIEVRYPLLDEELLDFSTRLAPALKLRGFKLRYFFKHALRGFLPPEILSKSKHGFGLPFGVWMNTYEPLREIANESLNSLAQRGIVKPEFIAKLQQLHQEYPSYYGVMIWILMMLEQWFQSEPTGKQ